MEIKIYNDDCFDVFEKIDKKIDLVLVDLPYGQTSCDWDKKIDLKKMWKELINIISDNCILVFFCTTKYGYELIESNKSYFRYDLVWGKNKSVGYLSSNVMPLRDHEMIYIFSRPSNIDIGNNFNSELRDYFKKIKKYIGKTKKQIQTELRHQGTDHCFRNSSSQFSLPTEKTYNQLIEKYNIDKIVDSNGLSSFIKYKEFLHRNSSIYNPQMTKGKPYACKATKKDKIYNADRIACINNGTRYPKSILKFNNTGKESFHSTQKPVDLCEWLIKTYSNENDLVLDFCMGSGSTGVACKNTNRKFIGIEKDDKIFNIAKKRLSHCSKLNNYNQTNRVPFRGVLGCSRIHKAGLRD